MTDRSVSLSSPSPDASRRSLLKGGAALGASALLTPGAAFAGAAAPKLFVRPDVASPTGAKMLKTYAAAVAKMQDPAINTPPQPLSWTFQAYIHGVPEDPFQPVESPGLRHGTTGMKQRIDVLYGNPPAGSPAAHWKAAAAECWGTCPHGSPFFVNWHRWYVYFFERIIRVMGNDPEFVLPYWNYASDQGASLQLPAAFQDPGNPVNPLYEDLRGLGFQNPQGAGPQDLPMNSGGYMPYSQTDYRPALSGKPLFPADDNFVLPPDPAYFAFGFGGRVEVQPHDNVHDNVGGLMSNVPVAALDPVFFVHHCQVDRLFAAWESYPGIQFNWGTTAMDPPEGIWKGRKVAFVDEHGQLVTRNSEHIETKELGYVYDNLPPEPPVAVAMGVAPAPRVTLAAMKGSGFLVGSGGGAVTLSPKPGAGPEGVAPPAGGAARTILALKNVKLLATPPAPLHVFLNLPAQTAPTLDSPYHVGVLNFFNWDRGTGGPMRETIGPEGEITHEATSSGEFRFDVGDILAKQKAEGLWDGEGVTVTVTTLGADRSKNRQYVSIGEVTLEP